MKVNLQNPANFKPLPDEQEFNHWVEVALNYLPNPLPLHIQELTVRIVDLEESAELNETYRHKSGPTNVLSFTYGALMDEADESLGDLVVCGVLVKQEAQAQNKPIKHHWAHLIVHGILHLIGYDHETPVEAEPMEHLEIKILNELNIANPYE